MAKSELVTVTDKKKASRTIRISDIVQVRECKDSGLKRGLWIVNMRVGPRIELNNDQAAELLKVLGQKA